MSKLSIGNLKKTFYYLKRNGLRDTYLAALERLQSKADTDYCYEAPGESELERQRAWSRQEPVFFSLLVPAYRTPEKFLRELIQSVLGQTYSRFELLIGDAGGEPRVKEIADSYGDKRILYVPLPENGGISANTNAVLKRAGGDFIGLLDHDDILTPDALFWMAEKIVEARNTGESIKLLYSDEDKCDESGLHFYDCHKKTEFNLDLLLTNNYICHFLVMEAAFMKELGFRKAYDGAQDYDLVLRGAARLLTDLERKIPEAVPGDEFLKARIAHIPRVLYHWRCHSSSTAANPQSKMYAYEAGGRAVEDFLAQRGWNGKVQALPHLGFYRVVYNGDILEARQDIGACGGKLLDRNKKITGGIYDQSGKCPYEGLKQGYSGYMHRAALQQDACAVDIRLMKLRRELYGIFRETVGIPYEEFEPGRLGTETDWTALSLELCRRIRLEGYRILWLPEWVISVDSRPEKTGKIKNSRYDTN